jgi:hypothetical protein
MARWLALLAVATVVLVVWLLWAPLTRHPAPSPPTVQTATPVAVTTPALAPAPLAPPPPGTPLPPGESRPYTSFGMAPAPPPPTDPVLVARQKLVRIRMKYRWSIAEHLLGHPIGADERARLEAEFEKLAARADEVVAAHRAATVQPAEAEAQIVRLQEDYRQLVMRELHLTEAQYAELPELPGGGLPSALLPPGSP